MIRKEINEFTLVACCDWSVIELCPAIHNCSARSRPLQLNEAIVNNIMKPPRVSKIENNQLFLFIIIVKIMKTKLFLVMHAATIIHSSWFSFKSF